MSTVTFITWEVFESRNVRESYDFLRLKLRSQPAENSYVLMSKGYQQHHGIEQFKRWLSSTEFYDSSHITWVGFGVWRRTVHFGMGDQILGVHLGGLVISMEKGDKHWELTGESELLSD